MRPLLTILFATLCSASFAQESPYLKFGKITVNDLQKKIYSIDSSATAVVLSDIGETSIEGNSKSSFSAITTRHKVVQILAKSAYDEANVEIPLYSDGTDEEKLEDIKAITYNLENGKVVESKLERSNVFTEKHDKNWVVKKFTMPNVKEGCIIEFQYKTSSDFINHIDPWVFQTDVPCLWSEFKFSVPQFFTYAFIRQGYVKTFLTDKKDRTESFHVSENRTAGASENVSFTANVTDYRWVMKDVPELKPESFTSSIQNHISKMEFQLTGQNEPLAPRSFRDTWPNLMKSLLESDYFGKNITSGNGWLSNDVKTITAGAKTETEKAKKIYLFVRDQFSCTDHSAVYADQSVKNVFKTKKGSVAEINLLLTAMLRNAGLTADPVILSKTSHGYTFELYPMLSRFNYVITQLQADGETIYLDASHNHLGFGKLLTECYNGHARVVDETATPVYFMADSVKERKVTALFLSKSSKAMWEGNINQTPGYFESYELRDKIKTDGQEKFFKDIQKEYGNDIKLSDSNIDSLNVYEEPLSLHYAIDYNPEKEDILYINPMFGEGYKKNPFKSAERHYPVEMPCQRDETYVMTMEVPDGYEVDELPKQVIAKLDDEGKSFFEYRIQNSNGVISLRSRIRFARTFFEPDEYDVLREFFNMIVKKQSEQIVFKKKKG